MFDQFGRPNRWRLTLQEGDNSTAVYLVEVGSTAIVDFANFTGDNSWARATAWLEALGLSLTNGNGQHNKTAWQVGRAPSGIAALYYLCLNIHAIDANMMADLGGEGLPDALEPTAVQSQPDTGDADRLAALESTLASQTMTCVRLRGKPGHHEAELARADTLGAISVYRPLTPHETQVSGGPELDLDPIAPVNHTPETQHGG